MEKAEEEIVRAVFMEKKWNVKQVGATSLDYWSLRK